MRRILIFLALACQLASRAQEIVAGADFTTIFDNREYVQCDRQESGTLFSACLSPWVGVQWARHNRLVGGVHLVRDFKGDSPFMTHVNPIIYYRYADSHWLTHAGIFERSRLLGQPSDAFYDERHSYTDSQIMGVHAAYRCGGNHAEVVVDWEGQPTETEREKFRVFSTALLNKGKFYCGYDGGYLHLANSTNPRPNEGVVDHLQFMPYVGMRFRAYFNFDLRATPMYSYQRDRVAGDKYNCLGGMVAVKMERWGLSLGHQLYFGDSQQPMRLKYGELLYSGNPMYGTTHKVYNKTSLRYCRAFFDDTVNLDVAFHLHHDGHAIGTQQMLTLGVSLDHMWHCHRHKP